MLSPIVKGRLVEMFPSVCISMYHMSLYNHSLLNLHGGANIFPHTLLTTSERSQMAFLAADATSYPF